ncbi:MAG: LCP family protein, partial [Nitriliruptorales bacterium]|nr:LCP family protein [Nitriliruptorales bacterium]
MTQTETSSDPRWGPTQTGGRERRPVRTTLKWLGIVLAVLAIYAIATAAYASSQIERVDVDGLLRGGGPLNLLVVGSDSRENLTPEERNELNTGSAPGQRTDTIFVMQISGGDVALLAFPRDLYVERCDGSQGRINAAMAIGGPGCLVETVSQLSGIPIDDYLEVQFLGFRDIVNAVGGVEMCLDRAIQDDDAGIDLPAGCQVLDGRQALGYVRVRKIDSDLER